MIRININQENYTVREEVLNGTSYLVAPVTMLVEGVLNGSGGPLFHSISEAGKVPASWNGIPLTLNHPQVNGNFVSANLPEVVESSHIGTVFNAYVEADKLKAEAWFNISLLHNLDSGLEATIRANKLIEVSVGVFTDNIKQNGDWNGTVYNAIATSHKPDHLAILPNETGACSINDGCGIGANKKEEDMTKQEIKQAYFTANVKQGFRAIADKIRDKLVAEIVTTNDTWVYIVEVFEKYFIYEIEGIGIASQYFKRGYVEEKDKSITLDIDNEVVEKVVTFNQENKGMSKNKNSGEACCPNKVDALIANAATRFEQADREWLLGLNAETIEKLEPKEVAQPEATVIEVNAAAVTDFLANMEGETALDMLPESIQVNAKAGLEAYKKARASKVTEILANTKGIWTEESLTGLNDATLESVHKTLSKNVDYSLNANGGTPAPSENKETPLMPMGV